MSKTIEKEFCPAVPPIARYKASAVTNGCIRLKGHDGGHVNGRNVWWLDSPSASPAPEKEDK